MALASTVILGFESHQNPYPRFFFCPRHVSVQKWGLLCSDKETDYYWSLPFY
jgi:hypothetical protein